MGCMKRPYLDQWTRLLIRLNDGPPYSSIAAHMAMVNLRWKQLMKEVRKAIFGK